MIKNILSQIDNINGSLEWIRTHKPADYEQKFLQLIEERRKLYKLRTAQQDNPAIAAYGVSQVGKSYLMNCILQKDGKPFLLKADGKEYNFIEEMNPKTDNTEATGVVTRFSSFSRDPQKYSEKYPILMRCLSVSDIILVLSDGYYNDISDYTSYSESDINEMAEKIYEKYKEFPINKMSAIRPDDVLDIKSYYNKHINNAQVFLFTSFFDILALIADRIPTSELADVFSTLWHKSEYQTRLFTRMLNTLEKFKFSEYVYLPAQAMLHDGINENTVMSVQCLNQLFLTSPIYFTNVYLRDRGGNEYEKVSNLTKSEVCAVCAEIIIKIDRNYIENSNYYSLAKITDHQVRNTLCLNHDIKHNELTGNDEIRLTTSILKSNDMLDFPGARSRKKEQLATLREDAILINVLLRGKVAYLFNKYNEAMLINILLYCHHAAQNDVTDIPLLLNKWIRNYVGDTMEKRRHTLEMTEGISPFFYIATKFNMDMERKTEDIANQQNAIDGRWQQRFEKVLYHQCFNADGSLDAEDVKIFLNWTRQGECFKNSYLLRDFKFSGPLASKLYENERTAEHRMTITEDYYDRMRSTFCTNDAVKRFFSVPELSWDVAASIDNDGALYIIESLAKIAEKMGKTREEQLKQIYESVIKKVLSIMEYYYVSTDIDELLESNILKARSIFREMDFTCNNDNYFFGHLLQGLQLTESCSYRVIHQVMHGADINKQVNSFTDYEIIRNSCSNMGNPLEEAKTTEDKWKCIMRTYGFSNQDEAADFLLRKRIAVDKLFTGNYKRKLNSYIIADAVYEKWISRIRSVDFLNTYADENHFDGTVMSSLIDNLIATSETVKLRDTMADSIALYVNVVNIHTANETLLADILASCINHFVLDFGYSFLTTDEIETVKKVCETRNLPAFKYILKNNFSVSEENELTRLFDELSTNPKSVLPSFDDNYNKWIEYMFISFIIHLDIPQFDHEANTALARIIEDLRHLG